MTKQEMRAKNMCINSNELRAQMARHGDTGATLAKALGITQKALSEKLTGKTDFTRCEIYGIKLRYNLSADEVDLIFFKYEVA